MWGDRFINMYKNLKSRSVARAAFLLLFAYQIALCYGGIDSST